MAHAAAMYRVYDLPWSTGFEQERRFKRLLAVVTGALVLAALILSLLPVPARNPNVPPDVPKRFARLLIEPKRAPPPPPVVRKPRRPVPPAPKAETKPAPSRPKARAKARPETRATPKRETAAQRARQARARASTAGLLSLSSELASLRDENDTQRLGRSNLKKAGAGTGAAPVTERSLITSRVGRSSGGINTAKLSRNIGGAGLAGRKTTRVQNPVAGLDPGDGDARGGGGGNGDGRASRSREEIERVFDRNKGAIYALYNRALRKNPALQGKLVLRLTIAPDGRVTHCEVVSSELGDRDLERKLVERVLLFRFQPKDVDTVTTTKPIDFFPA